MNGAAISALRAAPVLVVERYDLKRRELVLRVDRCTGPAVSALLGRAYPHHDVTVMAADDTLDVLDALQDGAAPDAPQLIAAANACDALEDREAREQASADDVEGVPV